MNIEPVSGRAKITIRVWAPIFEALVARTDAAFLRRDQLISHALRVELPRIREDLPGANSSQARRYMDARLRVLFATGTGSRQLSLALAPDVADELQRVCEDFNIPRESLLNRLFMFLGASGQFLADHFFSFTPDPITESGKHPDPSSETDLEPWETLPRTLLTRSWFRDGDFDVRGLALDLTRADPGSSDYDKALAPIGRITAIVEDPLRWYRWMLGMTFHQQSERWRETGKPELADAMLKDRWMYTPFGVPFDSEEELDGLNCHTPDSFLDQTAVSFMEAHPNAASGRPDSLPIPKAHAAKRPRRS